jgi:nicotinamide riboside transporter PnuC
MALISKNKPLGLLFNLVFLLVLWEWYHIIKTIYDIGIIEAVDRFSPRYLLWVFGNSTFIYLYVRNKLIAWHVEFTTIVTRIVLALVNTFLIQRDAEMKVVLAAILLYGGTATYMILRYRA